MIQPRLKKKIKNTKTTREDLQHYLISTRLTIETHTPQNRSKKTKSETITKRTNSKSN